MSMGRKVSKQVPGEKQSKEMATLSLITTMGSSLKICQSSVVFRNSSIDTRRSFVANESEKKFDAREAASMIEVAQPTPVPTTVTPIYRQRQVLLKIGDNFLRVGSGYAPVISKLKLPLRPPINWDMDEYEKAEELMERRMERGTSRRKRTTKPSGTATGGDPASFHFQDFVFWADESATVKESWYGAARTFFNIRLGVKLKETNSANKTNTGSGSLTYLSAFRNNSTSSSSSYEVRYDPDTTGCSWWTLRAIHRRRYLAQPLHFPDRCLVLGVSGGLALGGPLTRGDYARIAAGRWPERATLTVLSVPEFVGLNCCPVVVE